MDIWEEQVTLRFGSIDKSDRITLGAVFAFFQEAAISHATALGVGRDELVVNRQAWILSRISVFIEERPKYGDTITVKTWPRGSEKLFVLRDYEMSDSSGRNLVRGRSSWLVIDIDKRRPQRPTSVAEKLPLNEGRNALVSGPLGLTPGENMISAGERQAAYSDIDTFGHVNNVRYIQWIQDIIPPDMLSKSRQMRLDINYLNEILPGEKVELFTAPIETKTSMEERTTGDYPESAMSAFACEGRKIFSAGDQAATGGHAPAAGNALAAGHAPTAGHTPAASSVGNVSFRAELRLGL